MASDAFSAASIAAARTALDIAEYAARAIQTAGLLALHLMGPVRAVLINLDESGSPGTTDFLKRGGDFSFPFNPESLLISRSSPMSTGSGATNFAGFAVGSGTNDSLSFVVWLDASDIGAGMGLGGSALYALSAMSPVTSNLAGTTGTVLELMRDLYALTVKKFDPDTGEARLPVLAFLWQDLRFTGILTSLEFEVTLFDALGAPRRAKATLRMEGRAFEDLKAADVLGVVNATDTMLEFDTPLFPYMGISAGIKATALRIALRLV